MGPPNVAAFPVFLHTSGQKSLLWNVHNPDGTRHGPFPTEQLIERLKLGDVSGHAWVRRPEDETWQPLASFEAFSELCDPEAPLEQNPSQARLRFAIACGSVLFVFVVGMVL